MQHIELGINHQSPLIYWPFPATMRDTAGNQSPIPFDILLVAYRLDQNGWESITNPL